MTLKKAFTYVFHLTTLVSIFIIVIMPYLTYQQLISIRSLSVEAVAVEVTSLNSTSAEIKTTFQIRNPSSFSLTISYFAYRLELNGFDLGWKYHHLLNLTIRTNSNETLTSCFTVFQEGADVIQQSLGGEFNWVIDVVGRLQTSLGVFEVNFRSSIRETASL